MEITREKLKNILTKHYQWVLGSSDGERANLSGKDLRCVYLSQLDLRFANLKECNLRGVDLFRTDLRYADLRGADLCGADLSQTDLRLADLTGAQMTQDEVDEASLTKAQRDSIVVFTCAECKLLEVLAIDNGVTFYTCPYSEAEDAHVKAPSSPSCKFFQKS